MTKTKEQALGQEDAIGYRRVKVYLKEKDQTHD